MLSKNIYKQKLITLHIPKRISHYLQYHIHLNHRKIQLLLIFSQKIGSAKSEQELMSFWAIISKISV